MIFVDTNVLIDVFGAGQSWEAWSRRKLMTIGGAAGFGIDPVVVAELASEFASLDALYALLGSFDVRVVPLDDGIAFAAGHAFRAYRRHHKDRQSTLAEFLIGAHATILGAPLLTRDAAIYRAYFPDLTLITPEDDDHG